MRVKYAAGRHVKYVCERVKYAPAGRVKCAAGRHVKEENSAAAQRRSCFRGIYCMGTRRARGDARDARGRGGREDIFTKGRRVYTERRYYVPFLAGDEPPPYGDAEDARNAGDARNARNA